MIKTLTRTLVFIPIEIYPFKRKRRPSPLDVASEILETAGFPGFDDPGPAFLLRLFSTFRSLPG